MKSFQCSLFLSFIVTGSIALSGCSHSGSQSSVTQVHPIAASKTAPTAQPAKQSNADNPAGSSSTNASNSNTLTADTQGDKVDVTKPTPDGNDPNSIDVLVNKTHALPSTFIPENLVIPNITFLYQGDNENHMMRKEAADALEALVNGAKKDNIYLVGVSGYRSYTTQRSLYDYYVKTQGVQTADKYSAQPGKSEHETGLAIDIAGSNGQCAVEDCFASTPEAKWLADHASEYGFIIRYPQGKESITGYNYEPWHIRYVGKDVAEAITKKGWTLEDYYNNQEVALK